MASGALEPTWHVQILAWCPWSMKRILDRGRPLLEFVELRHEKMVAELMRKHGLKSAAKRERLLAAAEDEADEALDKKVLLASVPPCLLA